MPPSRIRLRIGESRCHQYSAAGGGEAEVLEGVDGRCCCSAASYIEGMCQAHMNAGVGENREGGVGEVAGPALDRRAGAG